MALTSCTVIFDCIDGNGIVRSEERTASSFTSVANETSFHVIVQTGDVYSVTVEAETNILPFIETDVKDGTLEVSVVKGTGCIRYTSQPVITITGPHFNELVSSGSGDIIADALAGEAVTVVVSGSGDVITGGIAADEITFVLSGSGDLTTGVTGSVMIKATVSGSGSLNSSGLSGSARYVLSGSGNIFSENLTSTESKIVVSGSGSAYTEVVDYLEATLSGSGNIYLHGQPDVNYTRTGSGRIIYLD